jgi:predicted anti-sigma-YlaC factor YlaD
MHEDRTARSDAEKQRHLDLLRLDACRAGEGEAAEREHIASCPACRKALDGLDGLAVRIRDGLGESVYIPEEIDSAVLDFARRRLEHSRRRIVRIRRLGWAAAAAVALLVLSAGVLHYAWRPPASPVVAADIDGSGSVDIIDAFSLALSVESNGGDGGKGDIDGNGIVDRGDVEAVARMAVALKGAGA